jgi:predicted Zn-dependent peptidase
VSKLTVNDSALLQNELQSDHAAISIVGDFNSKEMKATLTVLFSKWKKSVKRKKSPASKAIVIPQESRVNKEDARETTFISVRQE